MVQFYSLNFVDERQKASYSSSLKLVSRKRETTACSALHSCRALLSYVSANAGASQLSAS
jgi:hypothetical protein